MKTSRFNDTQIIAILKQDDAGMKGKDLCREHGISDANDYNWKAKYGELEASDLKRLKETEPERSKLKRMYAGRTLENRALKDLIEKKLQRHPTNGRRASTWVRAMIYQCFGGSTRLASLVRRSIAPPLIGRSVLPK